MEARLRFLSDGDIERIHRDSLRVLSEIGMAVWDDELCRLLEQKGMRVEAENLVRLPTEAVGEALEVAPRDFSLYGHDGQELPLTSGHVHPSTCSYLLNIWDYSTRALRPSSLDDLERLVVLGDSIPQVQIVGPVCWPLDIPEASQGLHAIAALLKNTTKHSHAAPQNRLEAEMWSDLVSIADRELGPEVGPTVRFGVFPLSPLQLEHTNAENLRYGAERGIPLLISSCPMAGSTGPYTIAGTLVQANAEHLFLLTVAQLVREGAPVIMGGGAGAVDLRTGHLSYGCPERHLMLGASMELARHYGVPHFSSASAVDAAGPDIQSGAEKMLTYITRLMGNINLGIAFGTLATASATSPEQMVIDADIFESARRVLRGFEVSPERIGFEAMKRVGPGGDYMMDDHTEQWMRSGEYYYSDLMNREGAQGASMLERAHAKVEEILGEHRPSVSEKVREEIEEYVEDKARCLG